LQRLDRAGITTSTLCAIHCTLVALLAVLPAQALGNLDQPWLEATLLTVTIGVAAVAVLGAFIRIHRNGGPLIWATLGIALLVVRIYLSSRALEAACSVLGAGCMIVAHASNSRLCRRSCCATRGSQVWHRP
jgi:hypothetical protein